MGDLLIFVDDIIGQRVTKAIPAELRYFTVQLIYVGSVLVYALGDAGRHFGKAAWELTSRAPEINLENERVRWPLLRHCDPKKGRIRHEPSIPVVLALDLDRRKGGRQRATRHYMLRLDDLGRRVEIDQVSAPHIDGAEAEAGFGLFSVHAVKSMSDSSVAFSRAVS